MIRFERWLLESRFHILDSQIGDDLCRARNGGMAHGLSAIRHFAIILAGNHHISTSHMCQEHAAKTHLLLERQRIMNK